jgi:hypothetical protein
MPTRLLDISGSRTGQKPFTVQLILTKDTSKPVEYAALSYCWGKMTGAQLTSANMNDLMDGVSLNSLSRTAQDAVMMANYLGMKWLWVDSLCIMQNSKEDWEREAGRMVDVYQNSSLTIAARGTDCSSNGIFTQRDPLAVSPCPLVQQGVENILALCPTRLGTWPLDKRAWALQERVLSRRLLSFSSCLSWECLEAKFDEMEFPTIPVQVEEDLSWRRVANSALNDTFFDSVIDPNTSTDENKIKSLWEKILERYCLASLTNKTDRLIALDGIATAIRRRTGWDYVAGLWIPFIEEGLLWESELPVSSNPTGLGPSWSWAAITGSIYTFHSRGDTPRSPFHLCRSGSSIETKIARHIKICTEVSNAAYWTLQISCPAIKFPNKYFSTVVDTIFGIPTGAFTFRLDTNELVTEPLWFLPICTRHGRWNRTPVEGLLVCSSPQHLSYFKRVGVGHLEANYSYAKTLLDSTECENFMII